MILACSAVTLFAVTATVTGQEASTKPSATKRPTATRADLAWAYLRLERAYFANMPAENSRVAQINEGFDSATKKFFTGKFAETIAEVNDLTAELIAKEPSPSFATAMSLKPTVDPPVSHLDRPVAIKLRLTSIYSVEIAADVALRLMLKPNNGGQAVISKPIPLTSDAADGIDTTIEIEPTPDLVAGDYSIVVTDGGQTTVDIGQLNVVSGSLDAIRTKNETRLGAVDSDQSEIVSAVRACLSRNEMLQDQPSSENSLQFLSNFTQLAEEIGQEIAAIEAGNDPYRRRAGDYWRTFSAGSEDKPVACRVYAPQKIVGDKPVPLVIVLHGAGGDENMFFTGYGAGLIKQLADERGFLVASPATAAIGGKPERFDTLITELSSDYAVDPDAIFLIGHSMGGFTTYSLASKRPDKIAAACCLAGGGRSASGSIPPMLIIAGELDSVVPTAMLKRGAQQAIDAGLPVEFRVKEDYGHTLLVGAVLTEAVDWLLSHRLGGPDRSE
jgi:predicted esterase